MTVPTVSVVLPVYNCPRYVGRAIESILSQTYQDFELIIVDDGSTDSTPTVLRRYEDSRIRLITKANEGLAATLNYGIRLATGRYIARQDQDDLSLSERFGKQVAYLDAHPRCALVGTWAEIWREDQKTDRVHKHPQDNSTLKFELLLNNPFVHSSVMARKASVLEVGGYSTDPNRQPPEDYELWSRVGRAYEVANIPEILHVYRETQGSMSRDGPSPFLDHLVTICAENIAWAAERSPDETQIQNIAALVHGAKHRILNKPNLGSMREIFSRAAVRVVAHEDQARTEREAIRRIDMLRYRLQDKGWQRRFANVMARIVRACRSGL